MPDHHRIRLLLHYDGGGFAGWQLQPDQRTVQGEIEGVLERLLQEPRRVTAAGRTDRGVHATGQVAAVEVPDAWNAPRLRKALNALLPRDVWVAAAERSAPRFHPRFDAVAREYVYRVGTTPAAASPFRAPWCWPLGRDLDVAALRRASAALIGDHSFRAFAKAGQEARGDRCIVGSAGWDEWRGGGLAFRIRANRFLHHMVRYLVGTLVEIGSGRRAEADVGALLAGADRVRTAPPAPPQGLFLTRVEYPHPDLPTSADE